MMVALDNNQSKAVLGIDVNKTRKKQADTAVSNRYSCLFCESQLRFCPSEDTEFGYFVHETEECVNDGNVSSTHRLAQEISSMQIFNLIPEYYDPIPIEIEGRIGDESDFVISDVQLTNPKLVIEIVHLSTHLNLSRRLKTLFDDDYAVMLVCITTGRVSPHRIQQHLRKLSSIRVGQFDPNSLELRLGSVITSDHIDPVNSPWHLLPNYLA